MCVWHEFEKESERSMSGGRESRIVRSLLLVEEEKEKEEEALP